VNPTYALRLATAAGAVGIILLGVVPMVAAASDAAADPILSQAINGTPQVTNAPAPAFHLVDQYNRAVSLSSLQGKTIGLTFLDPVCTSDCPLIAQEFRAADIMLGGFARHVELVAVDANPRYIQPEFLRAFDAQEGLDHISNWLFLTGSLRQLESAWTGYGCQVTYEPGGAMVAHSDLAYVINGRGHTRDILNADPGPATAATQSSFSVLLTNALRSASS
jgi:cytochrome oxidase Cu insertion factor (SCO1/SenC/PrrC family)